MYSKKNNIRSRSKKPNIFHAIFAKTLIPSLSPRIDFLQVILSNRFKPYNHTRGRLQYMRLQNQYLKSGDSTSLRVASVIVGGIKLAGVGFISSIGAVAASNVLNSARKFLNPALKQQNRRSPILKTAVVYSGFLGTSANLRYQIIAGLVEHRLSDMFADQTLFVNMLSFVARTINSYWGTQVKCKHI